MLVETTNYFAKPGRAEEVLEHRRRGSRLRLELGLEPGRIFVRRGDKGPDVRWECVFPDDLALAADLAVRDQSPAFALQRQQMSALLEHFERQVHALDDTDTVLPPMMSTGAPGAGKETQ